MAVLIKRGAKHYLKACGGYRNNEKIAPTEVEVLPPLKKIDEWRYSHPDNALGEGINWVTLYKDAQGKTIAVHKFIWNPAPGYSWSEEWEKVTDDPKEIERLRTFKEEIIEENL